MTADLRLARAALAAACPALRSGGPADAVTGITPAFVATPAGTQQAAALLGAAASHDLAIVASGGGSRLSWGAPVTRCDLVIDMTAMTSVTEHAAGDLVARVQAGARFGEVAAALAAAGQEIALDVPPAATIGGLIGDALAGPRRLRYGSPRDLLIGITLVRADGTVAHSGGKVVKNVAGYDLGKLLAGSAGTLALVTDATFRLHPLPAARRWVTATVPAAAQAAGAVAAAATAAAGSPLVPSAVDVARPAPGGPLHIGVLIEGSAEGVTARAAAMAGLLGATLAAPARTGASAPDWWGPLPPAGNGTLLRVSFWAAALTRVLNAIDEAARAEAAQAAVHGPAGAGLLHVALPGGTEPAAVARIALAAREAIPAGRGGVLLVAGPEKVRAALPPAALPGAALMRAVKGQFDPGNRMAPGRFPAP